MVVGSDGIKAGLLAGLPLVILNIVATLILLPTKIGQAVVDAIVTLIVLSVMGLIIAGLSKALFFVKISPSKLSTVLGLVIAGVLIYDGRPEVLIGHGLKYAAEKYIGVVMAGIIPPLAAGLFWGMMMSALYNKSVVKTDETQQPLHRRLISKLVTRRLGQSQQANPTAINRQQSITAVKPQITVSGDRCALCGRKKGRIFTGGIKFMTCKAEGLIYCENCYSKFPLFGGITRTCPRCGNALSPMK